MADVTFAIPCAHCPRPWRAVADVQITPTEGAHQVSLQGVSLELAILVHRKQHDEAAG